MENQMIELIRN